jgi:hypothetical protein
MIIRWSIKGFYAESMRSRKEYRIYLTDHENNCMWWHNNKKGVKEQYTHVGVEWSYLT